MEKRINRKTDIVVCSNCGQLFNKAITEINRTNAKGGKHYCSRKCCGKGNIAQNLNKWVGNPITLHLKQYTTRDKYTGFREFIRRAKNRNKLGNLTLDDLIEQWNNQNGICPYTGISLKLPKARNKFLLIETASLDRIDSNKLYEKGNIVFVSTPINYMKNSMSEEETISFCKKIALYWNNKL
jgi:hypothetical protein